MSLRLLNLEGCMVTVITKEELKAVKERGEEEIVIIGELAEKIRGGKSIVKYGAVGLAVLGTAIAAAPFTGGVRWTPLVRQQGWRVKRESRRIIAPYRCWPSARA
jgi:hypothetical protein